MATPSHSWRRGSGSPLAIIRRKEVEGRTGLSRSTIYERIKAGTFPAPLALGAKAVGWDEAEINEWIADRLKNGAAERAARNPVSPPQRQHKTASRGRA